MLLPLHTEILKCPGELLRTGNWTVLEPLFGHHIPYKYVQARHAHTFLLSRQCLTRTKPSLASVTKESSRSTCALLFVFDQYLQMAA